MSALYKLAEDKKQQNNSFSSLASIALPTAVGVGTLMAGRKFIPKFMKPKTDADLERRIKEAQEEVKKFENADHLKMVHDLYQKHIDESFNLPSKFSNPEEEEAVNRRKKELSVILNQLSNIRDLPREEAKKKAKEYFMNKFNDFGPVAKLSDLEDEKHLSNYFDRENAKKIGNRISTVGALGAVYGTHKLQDKYNSKNTQINKTASDSHSENNGRDSFIRSSINKGLGYTIPGANNLAGFAYGLKTGHPVVGLLGGTPAVEGARRKDGDKGTLIASTMGGAAGGGLYGYIKKDKVKDGIRSLFYNLDEIASKAPSGEQLSASDWRQLDKNISALEGKHTGAIAAVLGGLGTIGAYGLGRVFGSKKDKQ